MEKLPRKERAEKGREERKHLGNVKGDGRVRKEMVVVESRGRRLSRSAGLSRCAT